VVSELVPFLYVKKLPTAFASISTLGFFPSMFCTFFFGIDQIFKRNSRQSSYSNPRKVFFRQVYKPLGRLHILSTHITFYSQSAQQVNSKMRSLLILLCFVVLTIAFVGNDLFDGV
jgi:hypothetical protein